MLHIKLEGIEHRAPWKQICRHNTYDVPTTPGVGSNVFFFLLKVVMLYFKLKWKKCRPTCKVTLWIYTHPWPLGLSLKGHMLKLCRCKYIFIKVITKKYLTGVCYDLNDTEGELRVYVLWFTCFSQITLRRGYKFVEFVLFVLFLWFNSSLLCLHVLAQMAYAMQWGLWRVCTFAQACLSLHPIGI